MHDLVVRNGTVIDGTGAAPVQVDVAIDDGLITALEPKAGLARREVNAEGLLVTPGWVDIHTHYDGQATWDPAMTPSSWHGVTTTIFGNCGVGFAPVRPGSETYLINLMEGVEDIPEIVLSEGLDFRWETFGEYLDVLEESRRVMDVGVQVPHAPLRFYVMGDRGADHNERPTEDEVTRMGQLLEEALRAGAFGFSTSRTTKHRAADGRPTPSLSAAGTGVSRYRSRHETRRDGRDPGELRLRRRRVRHCCAPPRNLPSGPCRCCWFRWISRPIGGARRSHRWTQLAPTGSTLRRRSDRAQSVSFWDCRPRGIPF